MLWFWVEGSQRGISEPGELYSQSLGEVSSQWVSTNKANKAVRKPLTLREGCM